MQYIKCVRDGVCSATECGKKYPDVRAGYNSINSCQQCFCEEECAPTQPSCVVRFKSNACNECVAYQCSKTCEAYTGIDPKWHVQQCVRLCGFSLVCVEYCATKFPAESAGFMEHWDCAMDHCGDECSNSCAFVGPMDNGFTECDFCRNQRCVDECAEVQGIYYVEYDECRRSCNSPDCYQLCDERFANVLNNVEVYMGCLLAECPICFATP